MLIRHGETVGQSSIRLYGATDVALAPEGERQVARAGDALVGEHFDAVFTSPLQRARRSAEIVLDCMKLPHSAIEEVEGFREVDFGRWEGWTWAEVAERDPDGLARSKRQGPTFTYPQGEARQAFVQRVQAAVGPSIEARFDAGAERVLAVVHKGVIKAIAARLLECEASELNGLALPLGALRRMHATLEDGKRRWTLAPEPEDA